MTDCVSFSFMPPRPERRYSIACCECGKPGVQIGKRLPRGWRWRCNGMRERYYCESVVCWDRSWPRRREDWCSA
jgi:hypothetical protein